MSLGRSVEEHFSVMCTYMYLERAPLGVVATIILKKSLVHCDMCLRIMIL